MSSGLSWTSASAATAVNHGAGKSLAELNTGDVEDVSHSAPIITLW